MNQIKIKDRFHHLIQKYQTTTLSCVMSLSYLTICQNSVYGNVTLCDGYANDCGTMTIDMHMNTSNNNDVCYKNHYRGNIILNSTVNKIFNYTIIGHVFFCNGTFNGTASMCNDDCDDTYFEGDFIVFADNNTCHQIGTQGILC
jgi:hypothetical protein